MAHEQSTTETALGGPSGLLVSGISTILKSRDRSLTFGRGTVSSTTGFTLRPIDPSLSEAEQARQFVEFLPAVPKGSVTGSVEELTRQLGEALDFFTPGSLPLEGLLETLAQLLINPVRAPGEPCLAPAPLLRDLLDVALGKVFGGLGAAAAKVAQGVEDFLFPAFAQAADLEHFIQAVLDDPITAALNLILGQRNQIDCVVEGALGVGAQVIEFGVERIEDALGAILF